MNAPSKNWYQTPKIGTAVWLLSFPYLPMRGLYPDATPNMQNTLGTLRLLEGPRTKNAEQRYRFSEGDVTAVSEAKILNKRDFAYIGTTGDDPKVFEAKIQIVVIFTWVLSFVV